MAVVAGGDAGGWWWWLETKRGLLADF